MAKNQLKGKVVSNKMKKTVVVQVEQLKKDKKYKRRYIYLETYKAHDEKEECGIGDEVIIEECRPISKEKKWRVVKRKALSTNLETGKELEEPLVGEEIERKKEVKKPKEEKEIK